jgi:hypothetical protein
MTDEKLSASLQQNLLCLLTFDAKNCKLVRTALTPKLFESSIYREIAGHAIDFIDQFDAPIADHLPDELESILNGDDKRKAATYQRVLEDLFAAKDSLNSEYIISQLHKFVRQQTLKSSFVQAVELFESGKIDECEVLLEKALKKKHSTFDPGLNFSDPEQVGALLDDPEEEGIDLNIPDLDRRGIKIRRKEICGLIAARGKGKSWACTHVAKMALLQGWKPLVITLEMSEKRYGVRFLQSFFSISKREALVKVSTLRKDREGGLTDIICDEIERQTLKDDGIQAKLKSRSKREFRRRPPLRIKAFPTGQLTIQELKGYLDQLERFENFIPDVIIIDYPDLMTHDVKNKRLELGRIFEDLRGIGVERNCAIFTPTQGNRDAETATTVKGSEVAEDISKLATWDTCLTYSQTEAEYKLGLGRIFVEKARNEEAKLTVLITQAYAIGQFCLDSVLIGQDYWDKIHGGKDRKPANDEVPAQRRARRKAA